MSSNDDPQIINVINTQTDFTFTTPQAAEIIVEEKGGKFKIYRITEKMVPKKVKEEMVLNLFDGNGFGEFLTWMTNLNNDELEAARQIYFDIWNFKSGDSDDKARFELIEGEQKKRKSNLSSGNGTITLSSGGVYSLVAGGAGGAGGSGGVFFTGK